MVYRSTHDVVHRVMPLLDRLCDRSEDKAVLLRYLSARAGEDWGVLERVPGVGGPGGDPTAEDERGGEVTRNGGEPVAEGRPMAGRPLGDELGPPIPAGVTFRDPASGATHVIGYPAVLPPAIEGLVVAEYKRLATGDRLTKMAKPLFDHFFAARYCDRCRWSGPDHRQVHLECHFAGFPTNFEPRIPLPTPRDGAR